jgi:hypothetical protein
VNARVIRSRQYLNQIATQLLYYSDMLYIQNTITTMAR